MVLWAQEATRETAGGCRHFVWACDVLISDEGARCTAEELLAHIPSAYAENAEEIHLGKSHACIGKCGGQRQTCQVSEIYRVPMGDISGREPGDWDCANVQLTSKHIGSGVQPGGPPSHAIYLRLKAAQKARGSVGGHILYNNRYTIETRSPLRLVVALHPLALRARLGKMR